MAKVKTAIFSGPRGSITVRVDAVVAVIGDAQHMNLLVLDGDRHLPVQDDVETIRTKLGWL